MQNQRDEEAQTPDRDSNEPQQRPSPRCSKLKEGHTGGRAHWKPGPSDRVRQYLLSEQFQASIQLALSVLLISIFLFVEQLYFTEASIGAVVVTIAMILASLDLTAGGRIFGAAMLSSAAWAALLGGIILTVARYTRAYPTFLTLFAVLYIAVCATVRVHDNIKGLILGSIGSIVLTIGQFVWPAHVLWTQVAWALIRAIWLASLCTIVTGLLLYPTSCREAISLRMSDHLLYAGHALSAIGAHLLPPCGHDPHAHARSQKQLMKTMGGLDLLDDVPQELPAELLAHMQHSTDPEADHSLRHLADPTTKTVGQLRPAIFTTQLMTMTAHFEPAAFGSCRIELSCWANILQVLQPLITHIAVLESLLEGQEPVLHSQHFMHDLGFDPLPLFRLLLATVCASMSKLSHNLKMASVGKTTYPCLIATHSSEACQASFRSLSQQKHSAWQEKVGSAASFQGVPLERRVLLTLRVEALTIYTGVCNLEQLINKAIGQAPAYSWPWQWSLQPLVMHAKVPHNTCDAETQGSALQALQHRAFIELEFATAFLIQLSGKPYLDTFRMAFVDALPKSFGSWAKAKHTIRHNRSFRFGIKFFLATAGAMAVIFPLSAHNQTVAANRQYFLLVALIASYQERADASIVRAVSRVTKSAIAASLGFGIMHNSRLATDPYTLTALACAWAFLAGHLMLTPFRYACFLAVLVFNAMIYNQFSYVRIPGATGTKHYYVARLSEYGLGITIALVWTMVDPWFLADDALEQIGAASENAINLACDLVDAYVEEVALLEHKGSKQAKSLTSSYSAQPDTSESCKSSRMCSHNAPHQDKDDSQPSAAAGLARVDPGTIIKQVSAPLALVMLQVQKEQVVWSHGPLSLPNLVSVSITRLQLMLERLSLVNIMARQQAFTTGQFTCAPYEALLQPMEEDLAAFLQAMRSSGRALATAMLCKSTAEDLIHLQTVLEKLDKQRHAVQLALRRAHWQYKHSLACASHIVSLHHITTEDDVIRAYGTLLAISKVADQTVLFGRTVCGDMWLQRRTNATWLQSTFRYSWR